MTQNLIQYVPAFETSYAQYTKAKGGYSSVNNKLALQSTSDLRM